MLEEGELGDDEIEPCASARTMLRACLGRVGVPGGKQSFSSGVSLCSLFAHQWS